MIGGFFPELEFIRIDSGDSLAFFFRSPPCPCQDTEFVYNLRRVSQAKTRLGQKFGNRILSMPIGHNSSKKYCMIFFDNSPRRTTTVELLTGQMKK